MNSKQFQSAIEGDFSASYWLQQAVGALAKRDPCDALNDVEALLEFCRLRVEEARA